MVGAEAGKRAALSVCVSVCVCVCVCVCFWFKSAANGCVLHFAAVNLRGESLTSVQAAIFEEPVDTEYRRSPGTPVCRSSMDVFLPDMVHDCRSSAGRDI